MVGKIPKRSIRDDPKSNRADHTVKKASPAFGQIFLYFGEDIDGFAEVFYDVGLVFYHN